MAKKKKNRNATGSDQEPGADQAAEITRLRAQNEKLQKQLSNLLAGKVRRNFVRCNISRSAFSFVTPAARSLRQVRHGSARCHS